MEHESATYVHWQKEQGEGGRQCCFCNPEKNCGTGVKPFGKSSVIAVFPCIEVQYKLLMYLYAEKS